MSVKTGGICTYLEVPLLYYPGYRAEMDGQTRTVVRGTNNMVRIYGTPEGGEGVLHVWYQPPTAWLLAQGASAQGVLLLALSLCRMRKRA